MANNENVHQTELPEIVDDGINNNYGEWKIKSYYKLREWDLLQYIEGPKSEPPVIPPLRQQQTYHGVDDHGNSSTVHVLGNTVEHQQAITNAKPWMTGNNTALSCIVAAVPGYRLHLVQHVTYAKQAWESLRSFYQSHNLLRAATIKGQMMAYRCTTEMDVSKWLTDMQRLRNSLCDLDTESMSDREFALAILDLMLPNDGWRGFVSDLRAKAHDYDAQHLPIHSHTIIATIRDEYWYRHKDDHQSNSHIFSARFDAQKRSLPKNRSRSQKRSRPADIVASSTSSSTAKRARATNANLQCANPHCQSKSGHDTANCLTYTGGKEGQYGDWWKGPWNLHLPEAQRTKENNVPPKNHPVYRRCRKKTKSHPRTTLYTNGAATVVRADCQLISHKPTTHWNPEGPKEVRTEVHLVKIPHY